jgi:hypothetical protein
MSNKVDWYSLAILLAFTLTAGTLGKETPEHLANFDLITTAEEAAGIFLPVPAPETMLLSSDD